LASNIKQLAQHVGVIAVSRGDSAPTSASTPAKLTSAASEKELYSDDFEEPLKSNSSRDNRLPPTRLPSVAVTTSVEDDWMDSHDHITDFLSTAKDKSSPPMKYLSGKLSNSGLYSDDFDEPADIGAEAPLSKTAAKDPTCTEKIEPDELVDSAPVQRTLIPALSAKFIRNIVDSVLTKPADIAVAASSAANELRPALLPVDKTKREVEVLTVVESSGPIIHTATRKVDEGAVPECLTKTKTTSVRAGPQPPRSKQDKPTTNEYLQPVASKRPKSAPSARSSSMGTKLRREVETNRGAFLTQVPDTGAEGQAHKVRGLDDGKKSGSCRLEPSGSSKAVTAVVGSGRFGGKFWPFMPSSPELGGMHASNLKPVESEQMKVLNAFLAYLMEKVVWIGFD
jgi:hypothetical protein